MVGTYPPNHINNTVVNINTPKELNTTCEYTIIDLQYYKF